MEMSSERRWCISVAVVKPMGTILEAVEWRRVSGVRGAGEGGGVDLLLVFWWLSVLRCL